MSFESKDGFKSDGNYNYHAGYKPKAVDIGIATKEQAVSGTDNTMIMTPLRTKEYVSSLGYSGAEHHHDDVYLKKEGGSLTGNITLDGTSGSTLDDYKEIVFQSHANGKSDHAFIRYYNHNPHYAINVPTTEFYENSALVIGVRNDYSGLMATDAIALESAGDIFLNVGTYNSPIGQGVPDLEKGNLYVGNKTTKYKVYHEGNKPTPTEIGAAPASHTHERTMWAIEKTITVDGDANTYYPVVMDVPVPGTTFDIYRGFSEKAPSSWNTATHKGSLQLRWTTCDGQWGGTRLHRNDFFTQAYTKQVAQVSSVAHGYKTCVWLRGGGAVYHYRCTENIPPVIYYEKTLIYDSPNEEYDEYIEPTTRITEPYNKHWTGAINYLLPLLDDGVRVYSDRNVPSLSVLGAAAASHTHPATQVTGLAKVAISGKYSDLIGAPASGSGSSIDDAAVSTAKTWSSKKIEDRINAVINAAPGALDTLKELSSALGNDPNFATTITNSLALKADKTYVTAELNKKAPVHDHPYAPTTHTHAYLPLTGGTLTGKITLPEGQFFVNGNSAIDLSNSDIVGINGLVFSDEAQGSGEGICWPKTGKSGYSSDVADYDILKSYQSSLFYNNYKVYHEGYKPTASQIGAAPASHTHSYLPLTGGALTGRVDFANGIYNRFGDDVAIGDVNQAGRLGIKGLNGKTGIRFTPYSGEISQDITISGTGVMTITGLVKSTFQGGVKHFYDARQANADQTIIGDGTVKTFLATSTMTKSKPMADGYITHYEWDHAGGFSAQLFVPNYTTAAIQFRGMHEGDWSAWETVYSTNHKPTPSEIGAAPTSHTHAYLPLTGGTLTGKITLPVGQYYDYGKAGLDAANSAIVGINSLVFCDEAESTTESIWWPKEGKSGSSPNIADYDTLRSYHSSLFYNTHKIYHEGYKPSLESLGAAPASHTHSYLPLSGGTLTGRLILPANQFLVQGKSGINMANSDIIGINALVFADEAASATEGVCWPKAGKGGGSTNIADFDVLRSYQSYLYYNTNKVYHEGYKPSLSSLGAAAASHTHPYLPLSGGTMTGSLCFRSIETKIECYSQYHLKMQAVGCIVINANYDNSEASTEFLQLKTGSKSQGLKIYKDGIEANEKIIAKKQIDMGSSSQAGIKYNEETECIEFYFA